MRPVIFLHGLGQTPQSWQEQVVALPAGTSMAAPWLPGLRPGDDAPFDLDAATEELRQLIELRGYARVNVVGNGLGALVGVRLAARYPSSVDHLVLSGPIVLPGRTALRMQVAALKLAPLRAFQGSAELKRRVIEAAKTLSAMDPAADLDAVSSPTLVIVGDRDKVARAGAGQLVRRLGQAEQVVLDAAGQPNVDDPEGFNAAMRTFLEA